MEKQVIKNEDIRYSFVRANNTAYYLDIYVNDKLMFSKVAKDRQVLESMISDLIDQLNNLGGIQ